MKTVRDAGLLKRTVGFYVGVLIVLTVALAAAIAGSILLGDSWFQLLIAGAIGVIMTQFAFVTHEISHRQVFASGPVNDRVGLWLAAGMVGISYSWWMTKHTKHHANPNTIGKDPDIEIDTISFIEEDAATRTGFMAALTRRQGYLFFPLLLLEGLNLHIVSLRELITNPKITGRIGEITIIAVRLVAYAAVIFWFLPLGMGFAFIGVQLAVFGLYMGASFAPNHKGMPLIAEGVKIDFLSRQVLTSRNVSGFGMSTFMGGLNYQIEHHLFPSMPRPHLAAAREIVIEHCATRNIPYTETTLLRSYGAVIQYLNRVGLSARDPFDCPMVNRYRRQ
ncbi:acyl-CoA desaturase [Klugiella xanthotipulae]